MHSKNKPLCYLGSWNRRDGLSMVIDELASMASMYAAKLVLYSAIKLSNSALFSTCNPESSNCALRRRRKILSAPDSASNTAVSSVMASRVQIHHD